MKINKCDHIERSKEGEIDNSYTRTKGVRIVKRLDQSSLIFIDVK